MLILLALIASRLIKLAGPLLFALGLNGLQASSGRSISPMMWSIAAVAGTMVLYLCLYAPARTAERYLALEVRRLFTDALYGHLIKLPLGWHAQHHSGELAHRVRSSSEALFEFAQNQTFYIQIVATVAGSIGTLLFFDPLTGLIALVGYVGIFILLIRMDRSIVTEIKTQNEAEAQLSAELSDHTGNAATVVALGLAENSRTMLRERLAEVVVANRRVFRLQRTRWTTVDAFNEMMWCLLVATAVLSRWLITGQVAVGTLVLVSQYAREITLSVSITVVYWQQLQTFSAEHANADPIRHAAQEHRIEHRLPRGWRDVEVHELTFNYSGEGRGSDESRGVRDASLVLGRGERVAVVGSSGSGKSTLLRVLAGLYPAETGRILVDGVPLVTPDLRGAATLVPQEPEIFTATVRYNLTLGVELPEEVVRRACDVAQLNAVLADLPDGLDTMLAERGANLSGGQRQRIAIARGMLAARDRSILLFDEPTSSLDPATELDLYQAVFAEFTDACIVSAVHRLHLLPSFDRVILMDSGRVVDAGTHIDLLTRQPVFQQMWTRSQGNRQEVGQPRSLRLVA